MSRYEALVQIDGLLETCHGCETRQRMNREKKGLFAQIDGHCNRSCTVGKQLQMLGKELHVRSRKKLPQGENADAIA